MLVGKSQQSIRPKQKEFGEVSQNRVPVPSSLSDFMSSKNLIDIKRPLKSNSSNLAFKGSFFNMYKEAGKYNVDDFFKFADDSHVGEMARKLYGDLIKSDLAKEMVSLKDGAVIFSKKKIGKHIIDGATYPVDTLPADMLNGAVEMLGHLPGLKGWSERTLKTSFFRNIRQRSKLDSKVNAMRGLFEFKSKAIKDALDAEKIRLGAVKLSDKEIARVTAETEKNMEWLVFQRSMKMFDPATGNYDTKHERALNRLVSGLPPALFLANDAYNLSRMMDDDPKAAQKEKKARFRQEVSRIALSGYLTLVTMGALQKYINHSKAGIMLMTGGTVLVTETYSRLRNGKHVTRLTPEQARAENTKKNAPESKIKPEKMLSFKSSDAAKTKDKEKQQKPLLSMGTLFKAFATIIAGGFAIKGLRKIPQVDAAFKAVFKPFSKIYKDLTEISDHKVGLAKIQEMTDTLKNNGFEKRAEQYLKVVNRSREQVVEKLVSELTKASDIKTIDKFVENLSKTDLDSGVLKGSFNSLLDILKKNNYTEVYDKYKFNTLSSLKNNNELIQKLKLVKTELTKMSQSNSDLAGKIKSNGLNKITDDGLLKEIETALGENGSKMLKDYKDALDGMVNFGTRDKKYKQFVKFVIAPFKFAWNVVKFPYKIANGIVEMFIKKAPKAPKSMDALNMEAVTKSFDKISKEAKKVRDAIAKTTDEAVKKVQRDKFQSFVYDNTLKAFNVDTMSNVSNSDLSNLAKTAASAATIWFLMTDNYNMVMLKSNGNDKEGAETKFKERFVQEGSRLFYQTLLIDLFNTTFRSSYNGSLLGMSWITVTNTSIGEWLTRKSVGVPVGKYSRDDLIKMEEAQNNSKGFMKGYYNFMRRLTGKRSIQSYKVEPKSQNIQPQAVASNEKIDGAPLSMTGNNIFQNMIKN